MAPYQLSCYYCKFVIFWQFVEKVEDTQLPEAVLELSHDTRDEMLVDGYPGAGEYVRPVIYDAPSKEELDAIIARASTCEQYIKYTCYQSKLLSDAGTVCALIY